METTTNTNLAKWKELMKAGERLGSLGDLMKTGNVTVYKDQFVRYEAGSVSAWVTVSETTKKKGINPVNLEVTLRDKITGEPGKVAQACAPGGKPATAADLAKIFG